MGGWVPLQDASSDDGSGRVSFGQVCMHNCCKGEGRLMWFEIEDGEDEGRRRWGGTGGW